MVVSGCAARWASKRPEVDQRRVIVAALERAEEIVAAGDEMGDAVDQAALVEGHQDASPSEPLSIARRRPPRSPMSPILRPCALARVPPSSANRRKAGWARARRARRGGAGRRAWPRRSPASVAVFRPGFDEGIPASTLAADQRAAPVGEQGVGLELRAGILVQLALEPLDSQRPADPVRDRLRQPTSKPKSGFALVMHRKRRPVLIEANLQRLVGRARGGVRRSEVAGNAPCGEPGLMAFSGSRRRPRDCRSGRHSKCRPRAASCCSCRSSPW